MYFCQRRGVTGHVSGRKQRQQLFNLCSLDSISNCAVSGAAEIDGGEESRSEVDGDDETDRHAEVDGDDKSVSEVASTKKTAIPIVQI